MADLFNYISDFSQEGLLAVLSLSLCLIYLSFKIIGCLLFSPLRYVPGPTSTKLTGAAITLSTKLEELYKKYSPIVSISDWRHLCTIYLNNKGMIKYLDFYKSATLMGKDNIF
ncbi:unnamed protein product [Fusarium fujikuroi]|nr:unnamed protein product [Fusarium fujikuroi]